MGEWGKAYMPKSADAAVEFQPANKEECERRYNVIARLCRKLFHKDFSHIKNTLNFK